VGLPVLAVQIDHFFAKGIKNADFKVLPSIGSDHYPIQAIINVQSE
jgi:endonuclease/exonuclease/phosphatase (EEP) superfamily protein YafD